MNVIQTRACATGKSCCPVISCVRADSKHGRYETSRTCTELTNSCVAASTKKKAARLTQLVTRRGCFSRFLFSICFQRPA